MTTSIGIACRRENWETCVIEDGRTLELRRLHAARSTYEYVRSSSASPLRPVITVSAGIGAGSLLAPLNELTWPQLRAIAAFQRSTDEEHELCDFLVALKASEPDSYVVPSLRQLSTLPAHRKRMYGDMGTSATLCELATLLYRMREQEAAWPELRFIYLQVDNCARTIAVIEDGRIVNAIGESAGIALSSPEAPQSPAEAVIAERAFWEGLEFDLAGLMAIHHFDDIVLVGSNKEAVIARLENRYQLYHYPRHEYDQAGFEAAVGAATLSEGLNRAAAAAEIVERLQLTLPITA
jgi:hypothetical protein